MISIFHKKQNKSSAKNKLRFPYTLANAIDHLQTKRESHRPITRPPKKSTSIVDHQTHRKTINMRPAFCDFSHHHSNSHARPPRATA